MSLMKILILLAIIGSAIHFKNQHDVNSSMNTASVSPNGFIELPVPADMEKDMVFVLAAEDCPEEDAQRADSLADELKNRNIPVTRTHSLEFQFKENPGPVVLSRIDTVMRGSLPVVFVNGKGKNNPSIDEVISEFIGNEK